MENPICCLDRLRQPFFGLPFFQVSKVAHHQGQNLWFKIREREKKKKKTTICNEILWDYICVIDKFDRYLYISSKT